MVAIPRPQAAIADRAGFPTREWYTYLLDLANSAGMTPDQLEQFRQLVERVAAIEGQDGGRITIQGVGSIVTVGLDITQVYLEGDNDAPGSSWYYGTGPDGVKAWYALTDAFTSTTDLTKAVDAGTGVSTFGLADVANNGAGTLLATTFDAKGRRTGSRAATITGTANQVSVANGNAAAGLPTISLAAPVIASLAKADSAVQEVRAGTNVTIDVTDPRRPIVNASGGGAVSSVNARTGAVAVPDFVSKATAPTAADYGRPLINGDRWRNTGNGVLYTQQDGAWLYDNAASLSRYVPARLSSGTASPIPLNADGSIPAKLSNGTVSNIPTQA
ncbi:hypothetical protein [Xanthomonas campestris]|uniref:hypothetical protein n=1 Tax=Xanthomonas campestris TaxID=339 RepID=UPI002367AD79|nr:hypothetical protein [Xanthomonas campestris]WDI91913.1 hypothetical protein JH280_11245 [Xanthomonas campestris]